ncbi:Hypothetical protein NTJ_00105 [Nesidiocoris tenuis]|uniref:Uncharacterized protein n=1 Tax=Nesidiocoris tenuis TaxID=355587 RepID=A0ABN7A8V6_9HEMI|nr:Hypothetical protein NTJ_00105 [Nesidiocoris tenuis]
MISLVDSSMRTRESDEMARKQSMKADWLQSSRTTCQHTAPHWDSSGRKRGLHLSFFLLLKESIAETKLPTVYGEIEMFTGQQQILSRQKIKLGKFSSLFWTSSIL